MLNTFIAILIEKDILTPEEGKSLAEKVSVATLPSDFDAAHKQVKKFFEAIAKGK